MNKKSTSWENIIDIRWIDGFINAAGKGIKDSSRHLRYLQSGQLGSYFLLMVLGIIILFVIFLTGL